MKQLKILVVAALLIGIVVAISYFNEPDSNGVDVDVERIDGDSLLELIDTEFCDKATTWNPRKYEKVKISMNAMAKMRLSMKANGKRSKPKWSNAHVRL